MSAPAPPPARRVADVGGVPLVYDEAGAGLPIVFVHGFPHARDFWAPQLATLAGRARCLAPDLRGFGETPAVPPLGLDRHADDLVALLDHAGIDRAVVCGLSMGGYVAFALWRRHPDRVRALVLADTRATADSEEQRARRRELIALARSAGPAAVADAQLPGGFGRTTRETAPERMAPLRAIMARQRVEGIVGAAEAMLARPDSTATLPTITVPTLIVVGDEDVITPPRDARAMHAAIPGSRLVVIRGAGHVATWERPEAFAEALGSFLDAVEQADRPAASG